MDFYIFYIILTLIAKKIVFHLMTTHGKRVLSWTHAENIIFSSYKFAIYACVYHVHLQFCSRRMQEDGKYCITLAATNTIKETEAVYCIVSKEAIALKINEKLY